LDEDVNPYFEQSLAEFASIKVSGAKRLIKQHGLRGGLPDAWCYELLHMHREQHVPESVREDFAFLASEMNRALEACPGSGLRGLRFKEGISEAEIEVAGSAFWRIYDAVQLWFARLNRSDESVQAPADTGIGESHGN
jgi:hypothetical protein